jgi:hypothetical protein
MRQCAARAVRAAAATTKTTDMIPERGKALWLITAEVTYNSSEPFGVEDTSQVPAATDTAAYIDGVHVGISPGP